MYKKILLPIDFDALEMGERSITAAKALTKENQQTKLRLINVQAIMPASVLGYLPPNFDEALQNDCEKKLSEISKGTTFPAEALSTSERYGAIYREVLAEAEDWGADLIIVGSHKPGVWTYLLGSNAAAIVRYAKCSVLVIR